jgi:molybdopterin/thiamine biosynthesis adenylyltransferase
VTTDSVASDPHRARILTPGDDADGVVLQRLLVDPRIDVIDGVADQLACLRRLRPPPDPALLAEPARWAYYPWRRAVVSVLGPRAFRRARLDRNRNLISTEEQDRLGGVRVGIAGLSVGHVIAHTLAAQGLCGELRLADFDRLELPNLNRVPATLFDLGVNKATVAARRIAELDPYLPVRVLPAGLTSQSLAEFLDGLDIVVEECDSLDIKVLLREEARARGLPVLMATSHRGLIDVERYDLEPSRPVLHGLLGEVDAAALSGLTVPQKIPYVLRLIDVAGLSARGAASLVELGHSLSTWPQLAGDVAAGAGAVATAVRRIGLGEHLASGRVSVDIAAALDDLDDPAGRGGGPPAAPGAEPADEYDTAGTAVDAVVAAAVRAPSGGNAQPWRVAASGDAVTIALAPERTSTMDVAHRASAVAVGAAVFNARIAAAAHNVLGSVTVRADVDGSPLQAVISLDGTGDPDLADLYPAMLARETNRHRGAPAQLDPATAAVLQSAACGEGARLRLLTTAPDIGAAAAILGEADRIRYLSPALHADMVAELRWPHDASADSGIDVRSLELDAGQLAVLDILRRPDVMERLADWDAGSGLGADTRARLTGSSALGVIGVSGRTLVDYARGGSAAEAVWITAQGHGLAVQPVSPVFLYAHDDREMTVLSARDAATLCRLQTEFSELVGAAPDESAALVIRLFTGPRATVRSRRRRADTLPTARR